MARKAVIALFVFFVVVFLFFIGFLTFSVARLLGAETPSVFSKKGVGVVDVKGVISDSREFLDDISELAKDDDVGAIVLRIDSPGGAVAPSQEMFMEVKKVAADKSVVASMGTVAASGGYYVACAASKIFASPGSITGSIGVISQIADFSELLSVIRVKTETVKSGRLKDSGSPFRKFTEEDRELFEGITSDVFDQFLSDVSEQRKIDRSELIAVSDGRMLTGRQARTLRLVDEIGNFNDAVKAAAAMAGIDGEPRIITPVKRKRGLLMQMIEGAARNAGRAFAEEIGNILAYKLNF